MNVRPAWEMDLLVAGMRAEAQPSEGDDELTKVPRAMARVPKNLREALGG